MCQWPEQYYHNNVSPHIGQGQLHDLDPPVGLLSDRAFLEASPIAQFQRVLTDFLAREPELWPLPRAELRCVVAVLRTLVQRRELLAQVHSRHPFFSR